MSRRFLTSQSDLLDTPYPGATPVETPSARCAKREGSLCVIPFQGETPTPSFLELQAQSALAESSFSDNDIPSGDIVQYSFALLQDAPERRVHY